MASEDDARFPEWKHQAEKNNVKNYYKRLVLHIVTHEVDTGCLLYTSLEQLEIYKHTKTNKNDILNEQTQFKSHALFEHISLHTHSFDLSKHYLVANNKTNNATYDSL